MDRPFWWYGATLRDTDLLNASRFPMVSLGKLAEAMLGLSTAVAGFTLSPTAPASLSATLGAGQVYEAENLEASQWAAFGPDTHTLVKQGIALDPQTLTFVPPTTVGYAQNFLVEVQYVDIDGGSTVLPYYNAANPAVPYSGPGNAGTAQSTVRQGAVAVQIKAGVAATSGTQVSPSPDAGWAPLFVVTLAYGQTTVTSGNITQYATAPFIPLTLPQVPVAIQSQAGNYAAADTGTANAMVVTTLPGYTPSPLTAGTPIRIVKGPNANTGALTATINGTTYPVVSVTGSALVGKECPGGALISLIFNGASLVMAGPPLSATAFITGSSTFYTAGAATFIAPITGWYKTTAWGGGGGGGYSGASSSAGGGGGPGGAVVTYFYLTAGTYPANIGAAGVGGVSPTAATAGGTTSFNSIALASGGLAGVSVASTNQAGAGGNPGSGFINNGLGRAPPSENGSQGYNVGTILGGKGGSAAYSGGPGGAQSLGNGNPGVSPGGGGSGGVNGYGGNGAAGGLVIEW